MWKMIRRLVFLGAFLLALVVGGVVVDGYCMYKTAMAEMPLAEKITQTRAGADYTLLSAIPQDFQNAVLAVEDRSFYSHPGINPLAIARAVLRNANSGEIVSGGSTITQQLAKNLCFTMRQTLTRKVAELFVTFALERDCSKDEILELYLNVIYYGDDHYGVAQASLGYFGCAPAAMTLDQCTLLAGLPNAPSAYALGEHMDLARQRQQTVLKRMTALGYLTQEQWDSLNAAIAAAAAENAA